MTIELLQTLSLISYIVAGVLLLAAIAMFFLLGVPKLIGDVTGASAKKAIENIRQQNESTGDKAYKPSPVNAARGKLTEKISPSGKLEQRASGLGVSPGTEKFDTTQLMPLAGETEILSNETTILSEQVVSETPVEDSNAMEAQEFRVDYQLEFTGSNEIIE